jgi:branched-chain amino acid transport system permease protein
VRGSLDALGWRRPEPLWLAGALLVAAVLPLVYTNPYLLDVFVLTLIWMTLNQSWNVVLGVSGVWNFGHLGLYAIGGYTAGIVGIHFGISPWIALMMGGITSAAIGVVLALPSLRLRGIYASLLTFSFAQVVQLVINNDTTGLTGGVFGLSGIPRLFTNLDPNALLRAYYWAALAIAAVTALALFRLVRSPWGLAFMGLRDSEGRAASLGISPLKYQVATFGISAFFAGVAGALYASYYGVIAPGVMGLGAMTVLVTMLVVGGLGTLSGPFIGTALIMAMQTFLQRYGEVRLVVLGTVLLVVVVTMPRGIAPELGRLRARLNRWMEEDDVEQEVYAGGDPEATEPGASPEERPRSRI